MNFYDPQAGRDCETSLHSSTSEGYADEALEETEQGEDERAVDYELPPLPPVTAPAYVNGIACTEVYSIIKELRRQLDDPFEKDRAKAMLQSDPNVLLAVAQVLHEAGLLQRALVDEQGNVVQQRIPYPEAPKPVLPLGYSSWIVEQDISYSRAPT